MFNQQKSCNTTWGRGLWHWFWSPERIVNGNRLFNGCFLLEMNAVVWLLWGGTCQHLVALKMALPDLEGHPQHGRECAATVSPLFQIFSVVFPLCSSAVGLYCEDEVLLSLDSSRGLCSTAEAMAPGFSGGTRSRACAWRTSPYRVPAPAPVGLPWLCLTETENSRKHLWDLVCLWLSPPVPIQHQILEAEGLLLWLSWSQREMSAAVWWLSLTCLLLLSVRALNHFVLFHPITGIHFKLWNSPFLPWLICEICHLSLWFTSCPS